MKKNKEEQEEEDEEKQEEEENEFVPQFLSYPDAVGQTWKVE